MYPLGLALAGLSFGRTLETIREQDDFDPVGVEADLRTLIRGVACGSVTPYSDIGEQYLSGAGFDKANVEDEDLRQAIFET